jgi:hypothetical protein
VTTGLICAPAAAAGAGVWALTAPARQTSVIAIANSFRIKPVYTYFRAVTVISICAPAPASLVTPTVVRVGRGSLNVCV